MSVLKRHRAAADEPQVQLVHHRIRLERVVAALVVEQVQSGLPQVWVDHRKQAIPGRIVALAPTREQACDFLGWWYVDHALTGA